MRVSWALGRVCWTERTAAAMMRRKFGGWAVGLVRFRGSVSAVLIDEVRRARKAKSWVDREGCMVIAWSRLYDGG